MPVKPITVLYKKVKQLYFGEKQDILADEDTVITARDIYKTFKKKGYKASLFEVDEKSVGKIKDLKTDFLFNLCGGIGSIPDSEHEAAKFIETAGIPYSGANSESILLTNNKVKTKELFVKYKIPTARFFKLKKATDEIPKIKFPLIIKPSNTHCSFGIHGDSVVTSISKLRKKAKQIIDEYKGPALIEEYIDGRELNIAMLGNGKNVKMLPISEIIFGDSYKKSKWKIVDFAAKWEEGSVNYHQTNGVCPADLPAKIVRQIEKLCLLAYEKICDNPGYCRFDLRLSPQNKIYFLEINVNPDISNGMGASRSAKAAGYDYPEFLEKIVEVSCQKFYHEL